MLIKHKRPKVVQIQDLFSPIELDQLLQRKERYKLLQSRNKLIMTLLIYQALSAAEIKRCGFRPRQTAYQSQ